MKKIVLILSVFLLLAGACFADPPADVTVVYSGMIPQIFTWDDVNTDVNGDPMVEGDTIAYELFVTPSPFESDEDGLNATSVGSVDINEITFTVADYVENRGYYYVGVRSVGMNEEGVVNVSGILWSNDPVRLDPTQRFAFRVTGDFIPASPTTFNVVGP